MKRLFLLTSVFISLISCSYGSELSIDFTGDIMMHYAVKGCALVHSGTDENRYTIQGFTYLFEKVSPELLSADFAVGNMEFPVSPPFIQNEFVFNCPPEVIPALKQSGFYAVNLANNHILDQGIKGAADTFGYLEKSGLKYFGSARTEKEAEQGLIIEKNGIRVGILSYAGILNYPFPPKNPYLSINNLDLTYKVIADIKAMKKRCDFLVVQPHAGVEYTLEPTNDQRILYKRLCDEGADIIIGHHPHTLQYAENVQTRDKRVCTIFYSLGNFISNQSYTYPVPGTKLTHDIRDSVIVRLKIKSEQGNISSSASVIPIATLHEIRSTGRREYKDIQTVVISREIARLKKEAETANAKSRPIIAGKISSLAARYEVIRNLIYLKGRLKNVDFEKFPD